MKPRSATWKAICAVSLAGALIAVSGWASAETSGSPDSLEDLSEIIAQKVPSGGATAERSASAGERYLFVGIPDLKTLDSWPLTPEDEFLRPLTTSSVSQNQQIEDGHTGSAAAHSWETGYRKNYLVPALEIPGFVLALNGVDRLFNGNERENGKKVYSTTPSTFWDHVIHGPWGFDQDAFNVNQFLHPYTGTVYHGLARSAGLSFWESLGYTFAGSFLWETAGETTDPSINDQVATGIGGSLLGEPLFRMANLLLEGGGGKPGFWRELGAALISPSTGFNRLVFGDRFKDVFPSREPAVFQRLRLGLGLLTHVGGRDVSGEPRHNQLTADYAMSYGLPGKPGYNYTRPFDYFHFQVDAISRSSNPFENIVTRGLLFGRKYEAGEAYRGVWGLYGSFDYISPHIFRVSSTAASLGTTAQWWLGPDVALQGTALAGIGYGAAGQIHGVGKRDYHYGAVAQGSLMLRLILGDVAAIDVTGRNYYVSGLGSTEPRGREMISRFDGAFIFRVYGRHAIGVRYVVSRRDARYPDMADRSQSPGTVSLVYTILGDTRLGAVEWRNVEVR